MSKVDKRIDAGKVSDKVKDKTSRSGRNSKKRDRRPDREGDTRSKSKIPAINDISWYAKNAQLLKDAASINFSQMLGLSSDMGPYFNNHTDIMKKQPGVCVIKTYPNWGSGYADYYGQDALNIAAQSVYSWVRHQNSGHANYDVPDLMLYIMAMDQAYSMHAELVRLYGVARFFTGYNRYMGRYMVQALGYDYDSIVENLAQLRYEINQFAIKLSSFAVPAIMPIVERHRWMYSNLYMDKPSVKAQIYAFSPYCFGKYYEPSDTSTEDYPYAYIQAFQLHGDTLTTFSAVRSALRSFLDNVLKSEDVGIMTGDILKAYGAEKCYVVNALPEDYVVNPVYVPEVLQQIHNLVTVGKPVFDSNGGRTNAMLWQEGTTPLIQGIQNTEVVVNLPTTVDTTPALKEKFTNATYFCSPKILDMPTDNPTPEEVMVATRMMAIPRLSAATAWSSDLFTSKATYSCVFYETPADMVVNMYVYSGEYDGNNLPIKYELNSMHSFFPYVSNYMIAVGEDMLRAIELISKFDMHPILYVYNFFTDDGEPELMTFGQIENYTVIDRAVLERMHVAATLSLLDVPTTQMSKGV